MYIKSGVNLHTLCGTWIKLNGYLNVDSLHIEIYIDSPNRQEWQTKVLQSGYAFRLSRGFNDVF